MVSVNPHSMHCKNFTTSAGNLEVSKLSSNSVIGAQPGQAVKDTCNLSAECYNLAGCWGTCSNLSAKVLLLGAPPLVFLLFWKLTSNGVVGICYVEHTTWRRCKTSTCLARYSEKFTSIL